MNISFTAAVLAGASLALSSMPVSAHPLRHYRHFARHTVHHRFIATPYAYGQEPYRYGYAPAPRAYYGGPYGAAQIIEEATVRAQHEPGVTSELAPDAKQTATGGPVGGVPGFSGF